ncbi:MAG: hypothetical protein AWM53_00647 [Candidatus Dichloromethanomonas elyunquensis]|nr:MAG: hypothetical protein AWM53_00647 [Candidatus Dichloromethanomonas elyunquensis]
MEKQNQQVSDRRKTFAWIRLLLLIAAWILIIASIANADDCLRDVTRAED